MLESLFMISSSEAKAYADSYYSNFDTIIKIELEVRRLSASGEYCYNFYSPEIVKAYGTNTLTQDMQRILFELKKARYEIKFDFENQYVVIMWG